MAGLVAKLQAFPVRGPVLGKVEPPVHQGVASGRDVGGEHPDLAVRDLARGPGVLAPDPARRLALLDKAGLVDHQRGVRLDQRLEGVVAHNVAQAVGVPARPSEHGLLAPRPWVAGSLGAHPPRLAPLRPEQLVQERGG
jgi:hypothetical protein